MPEGESGSTEARLLASYVPRLLSSRLAAGGISEPEAADARGAVLLTDIAGFTSHVEHMAAAGSAGLDALAAGLNGYFSDLVAVVYEHGGDVLHVAGDAFFCWWPADGVGKSELAAAALRAAQAGVAIQAVVNDRTIGFDRTVATRMGLAAGSLRLNWVGGTGGRWELLPLGEPLVAAARAEVAAPAGGVLIAPGTWPLVSLLCSALLRDDGHAELSEVVSPVPVVAAPSRANTTGSLAPFVPASVQSWSPAVGTEWAAEIRPVTVLMASVRGLASAPLAKIHAVVSTFQAILARFDGEVKIVVDSKGITLAGFFGLSSRSHENDPERAVRGGQALVDGLSVRASEVAVGVATGRAFCGVFGSDLRREYTVHGDVVNLASRLAQAGAGAVVCDAPTVVAVRGRIPFDPLPPMTMKGRTGVIEAHRARAEATAVGIGGRRSSPLVGRGAEFGCLAAHLDRLLGGHGGGAVVIEGDAGLGKSRLVAECAQRATDAGVRVIEAVADTIERSTPYFAWRPLFTSLLGIDAASPNSSSVDEVVASLRLGAEIERLVPLLSSVTPVRIPDTELTVGMHGDVRASNTNLLLSAILRSRTADQPTLLVVEDAHWLDSTSWSLLLEIVTSVPAILTIVTSRPLDIAPIEHERLLNLPATDVVRLDGLDVEATFALVADRLGVADAPAALAAFVHERAGGHPFFSEELVSSLLERGAVTVSEGVAVVRDLSSLDVPATVEGVVISRLDRLAPEEVLSAKVAAVIGRSFRSSIVEAAHPVTAEHPLVPSRLAALAAANLTISEGDGSDPAYLFRHDITREVAYGLMTPAQRHPLHRAVAEWYEAQYADELAPYFAVLAHHWSQADAPPKAIAYLELSGEQALQNGAFEEARRFFSEAVAIQEASETDYSATDRAPWEMGIGTASYFLGNLTESRAHLEAAVAVLDRPVPGTRATLAAGLLRQLSRQVAHGVAPARFRGRRAGQKDVLDRAVACYRALGQIYYLDGDPAERLVYATLAGLNVGEEAGESPELARAIIHAGGVAGFCGLSKLAEWYSARAIAMVSREGEFQAAPYVWHSYAIGLATPARWSAALEANDRAMSLIRELGDFNLEAEAWQVRSAINICAGDYEAAARSWPETYRLGERNGNQQVRCWGLLDKAEVLLARGDVDGADEALQTALNIPTSPNDGTSAIEKLTVTALTRHLQGHAEEAVDAADRAVAMVARRPPTSFNWVDFCAQAVEIHLDLLEEDGPYAAAHGDQLLRRARDGCRVVTKVARRFPGSKPRALLLNGLLACREGDDDGARRLWEKAETEAARRELPFELARARFELARHRPFGRARDIGLRAAGDTFRSMGALVLLARVADEVDRGRSSSDTSGPVPPP
jgi:class 3 adenylate cyclase/tetratricopeptide (TPR) repeat protein